MVNLLLPLFVSKDVSFYYLYSSAHPPDKNLTPLSYGRSLEDDLLTEW